MTKPNTTISMNNRTRLGNSGAGIASAMLVTLLLLTGQFSGRAQTNLAPGDNSSAQVFTTGANAGVVDWTIDGQNILNSSVGGLQWFYYSVGGGTPSGIQNFGSASSTAVTFPTSDSASFGTTYTAGSGNTIKNVYTLTGGAPGSGTSDLTEVVRVQNNQASPLVFHFFQYAHFTIPSSTAELDAITVGGVPGYWLAQVNGGLLLQEHISGTLNPGAPEGTIAPPTIATLTSTSGFALPGPAVTVSGPGSGWLLEWDVTIAPNGNFTLSKDLNVTGVPEPSTLALLSAGLAAFGIARRFRRGAK